MIKYSSDVMVEELMLPMRMILVSSLSTMCLFCPFVGQIIIHSTIVIFLINSRETVRHVSLLFFPLQTPQFNPIDPFNPDDNVYTVEVEPKETVARMPTLFVNTGKGSYPPRFHLRDPNGIVTPVYSLKHGKSIYLTDGWKQLSELYGLGQGGWIDMLYDGGARFNIRCRRPNRTEIIYPANLYALTSRSTLKRHAVDFFKSRLLKWLKYDEITGDTMTMPRYWAYSNLTWFDGYISIVDQHGKEWMVYLKHNIGDPDKCGLTEGWVEFCSAMRFKEEQMIVFGVYGNES